MFVFFNPVLDCMMMMLVLMMCVHTCPMHADPPPPPPPPPPTVWPSTFTFKGTVQNTKYHKGVVGEYMKTTVMCVAYLSNCHVFI